jgi:hypothetical protein
VEVREVRDAKRMRAEALDVRGRPREPAQLDPERRCAVCHRTGI